MHANAGRTVPAKPTGDQTDQVDLDTFTEDSMVRLTDQEFSEVSGLVYDTFGINLTEKKKALVRGRLNSLLKSEGYSTFSEYLAAVKADPSGSALSALIDRISTNHSFFFREGSHFEYLMQTVIPDILQGGARKPQELRIWSAGCAAGEEPFTLAMLLFEEFGPAVGTTGPSILATDVSMRALQLAAAGIYPAQRVEGVPERFRKHLRAAGDQTFEVSEQVRRLVMFKKLNLMDDTFPFKGLFDVVFCRNVMIYFDQVTRMALVERFHRHMRPGGYLFIGHSETLGRDSALFRYVRPTVYRK
jgi:chemotaxis protein methyltransferase CheR